MMNLSPGRGIKDLRLRLAGSSRVAVIGIGDELSPVDRLGMLAAKEIDALNLPGLKVFFAGTVPETMTGPVRIYRPDHIILLDAAEMGIAPGTAAVLVPETSNAGTFSTHALPLSVVMEYLEKETGAGVTLLGIQPDREELHHGASTRERELLAKFVTDLAGVLRDARRSSIP